MRSIKRIGLVSLAGLLLMLGALGCLGDGQPLQIEVTMRDESPTVLQGTTGFDTLQVANGSASAPSYSFSSDSDLGLYRAAANSLGIAGDVTLGGTTPILTIGDAGEEDAGIVIDGNAQDFYMALDDSADDLLIGLGSTVGTTPAIQIDENLDITLCDASAADCDVTFDGIAQDFYIALDDSADDLLIGLGATVGTTGIVFLDENQDVGLGGASAGAKLDVTGNVLVDGGADEVQLTVQGWTTQTNNSLVVEQSDGTDVFWVTNVGDVEMNGTTPTLTIGDAGEEDTAVVFDGNAQDFHVGLDDTADSLVVGLGSALGTTPAMTIDSSLDITLGDATESDIDITYDGNAQDFYVALDDSADDLVIGVGATVGVSNVIAIDENMDVTLGDASEDDIDITYDGNAQDYYIALDDSADDLLIGLGATVGTTGIIYLDENQDVGLGGASAGSKLDVTGNVMVDGAADEIQLLIQGNATQTSGSLVVEDSGGTDILVVSEPPAAGSGGDLVDLTDTVTIMDGSDTIIGFDMNITGANATGTGNSLVGLDLGLTTPDAQVADKALVIGSNWDYAIDTDRPAVLTAQTAFADFLGDTVPPEWDYDSGSGATDPALNAAQYGTLRATTPGTNTDFATDHAGVDMGGVFWSVDQGGFVFEARVKVDNITNQQWCVGMTDTETMEMPAAIGGSDTITTTLSDGLVFCFDTGADTDEWFALGVAGNTDATGNAATGTAPSAGVYQILRIEADAAGADARFYIDGSLVTSLTANAVTAATLLTPVVVVDNLAAEVKNVDVDYIYVSAARN